MNIINQCSGWQAIPRKLINDDTLSYAAKGVYVRIAAMSENTEITAKMLQGELNKRTIAKLLLELRDAGWLEVVGERADGRKAYMLKAYRSEVSGAKNAPDSECKKCTRASAKNAPERVQKMHPPYNVYNINNINNKREYYIESEIERKHTPTPLPEHYHYPFDERLTIEQKKTMLIEAISVFVNSGAISPDSAKSFLLYWSEPLVGEPNKMRMESDDIKAWSLDNRIRRWTLKDKENEKE